MLMSNQKKTALYCRLSQDDNTGNESNSIQNQWWFGMKCHAGVDAGTGYVHTIEVTPADIHDVTVASELLRENDKVIYGDSGYLGIQKRPEVTNHEHLSSIDYRLNLRLGSFPKVSDNAIDWTRWIEKRKSSVRCKVEHVFRIIKCQFGYKKVATGGWRKTKIDCMLCSPVRTFTPWQWPGGVCRRRDKDYCALFPEKAAAYEV